MSPGAFDQAWRARALAGEPDAVAAMSDHALAPLWQFCFYRVGKSRHLCEEVVQETLLRAISELDRYDPARGGDDVVPWLKGLARNEIRRALAHEPGGASLDQLWQRIDREFLAVHRRLETEPLADEVIARQETSELVNAAMAQISTPHREVLEAKYVRGQTVRALADAWKTTEKAIESRLSRARVAFRETFLALVRTLEAEHAAAT